MHTVKPEWKFRIPQDSEVNQDPIEGEFFTTKDVGDFADALVRESIQNSLDAKLPDNESEERIVTVRFYFSGKGNVNKVHINKHPFFHGIYYHIFSPDNGLNKKDLPDIGYSTPYLVIEDFQTVGLDGSITENDDPKTTSPLGHNFYWFWRNVGRSGKKGSERGKWGLGKTVFPASSAINTFFAVTNRYDDNKNFLMGLSVLKTHHLANEPHTKRYPYGYYGNFEQEDKFFATPTNDESIINDFRKEFNLRRDEHTSSGLSVVIPFPRKEINSKAIIRSVLIQYFYPIINGKLIVEVVDYENGIDKRINDKSIFDLLHQIEFPAEYGISRLRLTKLFDLCLWSIKQVNTHLIHLNTPPLANSIMWRREWFINQAIEEILPKTMDEFDKGKRIAFNVPIKIYDDKGLHQICWFKIFLEKDELLSEADSYFIRNGITITSIKKPNFKHVRAIVLIEDDALVKLLGDAEDPGHTKWEKNSSHFIGKYLEGDRVISFVERSVDNLCSILIKPTEGIDKDLMKDIFFIELPDEDDDPDDPDDNPSPDNDKPKPPKLERKPSPLLIEREMGGFRIKNNPQFEGLIGTIKISTAYMVAKGKPLNRYSPFDYDLSKSPVTVGAEGVNNLEYKHNKISFSAIPEKDFSLDVKGFDEQRDLYIKAIHYDPEI